MENIETYILALTCIILMIERCITVKSLKWDVKNLKESNHLKNKMIGTQDKFLYEKGFTLSTKVAPEYPLYEVTKIPKTKSKKHPSVYDSYYGL